MFGERLGYNPEEAQKAEELMEEFDAHGQEIRKARSLKIVRATNVRGPERKRGVDPKRPEKERNLIVRWERTEILRALTGLREKWKAATGEEKEMLGNLMRETRERVKVLEHNLDILSEQLYANVQRVEVESAETGRHVIPVAELCLPDREPRENDVPYVSIAGIGTNQHQQAAMAMALALQGERVYTFTHPGNKQAETPSGWAGKVLWNSSYRPHAEVFKQVLEKIDLPKMNIVGFSMGAGVATEAARDPEFAKRIEQIDIIELLGVGKLGLPKLASGFLGKETKHVMSDPESKLKAFDAGHKTAHQVPHPPFFADSFILSRNQFDAEDLSTIARLAEVASSKCKDHLAD